jgi:poly-gamma-glutamate synthesis protein (capsule biosynthesis protein)
MDEIGAIVANARRQADWVIVTSHSHESHGDREIPAEFITAFAHATIDAGADMWVGHGPHVLRGIEIYNGKPIFYSLANFVFQNETVQGLPGEFYTNQGLDVNASPADGFDRRNQRSDGGFSADPIFWESVLASPVFEDGALDHVVLHPVTLGYGLDRPQRGRPMLANAEDGRRIIERLGELSRPYGTTVRYDSARNVGIVEP